MTMSPHAAASATSMTLSPASVRLGRRRAVLAEPDRDVDAALLQVERVGVPLAAVANDGHLLLLDVA